MFPFGKKVARELPNLQHSTCILGRWSNKQFSWDFCNARRASRRWCPASVRQIERHFESVQACVKCLRPRPHPQRSYHVSSVGASKWQRIDKITSQPMKNPQRSSDPLSKGDLSEQTDTRICGRGINNVWYSRFAEKDMSVVSILGTPPTVLLAVHLQNTWETRGQETVKRWSQRLCPPPHTHTDL